MTRHRLTYRGTPKAPWRQTRKEAYEDAVRLKLGAWDEHVEGRLYLEPFAEIETEED